MLPGFGLLPIPAGIRPPPRNVFARLRQCCSFDVIATRLVVFFFACFDWCGSCVRMLDGVSNGIQGLEQEFITLGYVVGYYLSPGYNRAMCWLAERGFAPIEWVDRTRLRFTHPCDGTPYLQPRSLRSVVYTPPAAFPGQRWHANYGFWEQPFSIPLVAVGLLLMGGGTAAIARWQCGAMVTEFLMLALTGRWRISIVSVAMSIVSMHLSTDVENPTLLTGSVTSLPDAWLRLMSTITIPLWLAFVFKWWPVRLATYKEFPLTPSISEHAFREMQTVRSPPIQGHHTHGFAANCRNSADHTMNAFIQVEGYDVYSVQMSSVDIQRGLAGSLVHLWPADRHSEERSDRPRPNHVFKLTNVDYYINWHEYMWMGQTFVLYTFDPLVPAGQVGDCSWTVLRDNQIEMIVAGGARYVHPLWDYTVDFITSRYCGVEIIYKVSKYRTSADSHWSHVLLTPHSSCATTLPDGCDIRRRQFVINAYTMQSSMDIKNVHRKPVAVIQYAGDNNGMAIADVGAKESVTLTGKYVDIIRSRMRHKALEIHSLQTLLSSEYRDNNKLAVAIIASAFPLEEPMHINVSDTKITEDVHIHYRRMPEQPEFIEEEKLSGQVVGPAVIESGFLPTRCAENERWTIETRVDKVRNSQQQLPPEYLRFQAEFLQLMVPEAGIGQPFDPDVVIKSQKRPTQRRANLAASPELIDYLDNLDLDLLDEKGELIKSFQKGEVYPAIKDPRNISTLPTHHCIVYSMFCQAFTAHLKSFAEWYAFGKHPDDVARRVHHIAANATEMIETDFSRFDGTHSQALYKLELALLRRYFHPKWHHLLNTVHDAMTKGRGVTTLGQKYTTAGGRLSGAADTSLMNSVDNAFVAYCTYRKMGLTKELAWSRLGIYGGDDGISADIDKETYERVATDLLLKLKATARLASQPACFLARYYPNPQSSPEHCADLMRQLSKLHVVATRDPQYSKQQLLYNKALGFWITDQHTPILGDWASAVLRCVRDHDARKAVKVEKLMSYNALVAGADTQRLNQLPFEVSWAEAERQLDIPVTELLAYTALLSAARTWDDFMRIPPLRRPVLTVELPPEVQLGHQPAELDVPRPIRPYFPYATEEQMASVALCEESRTYATPGELSVQLAVQASATYAQVVDVCAGAGVNACAFRQYLGSVVVNEPDTARRGELVNNLRTFFPSDEKGIRGVTVHDRVISNPQEVKDLPGYSRVGIERQLVFIDPPWGGRDYHVIRPPIHLSGMPIAAFTTLVDNVVDVLYKLPVYVELPPPPTALMRMRRWMTRKIQFVLVTQHDLPDFVLPGASVQTWTGGTWMASTPAPVVPVVLATPIPVAQVVIQPQPKKVARPKSAVDRLAKKAARPKLKRKPARKPKK